MDQYYGKVINDTAKIYFHSQNKKNPFLYDSKYPSSDINCQLNNLSKKINFEFNKSNLKSDSKKTLEKIATLLISFPKIKLSINGHTSSEGSVKYNNELSYNRANSVLKFLKEFGLKNKMEVFGYGSSQQIYDELDEINNPKNRRVEIILL
jgi:outer membrane protein OmpA-like peptidoglycan-associated protein